MKLAYLTHKFNLTYDCHNDDYNGGDDDDGFDVVVVVVVLSIDCIWYTSYHHHDFLQVTTSVTYKAKFVVSRMEVDDNGGGE